MPRLGRGCGSLGKGAKGDPATAPSLSLEQGTLRCMCHQKAPALPTVQLGIKGHHGPHHGYLLPQMYL